MCVQSVKHFWNAHPVIIPIDTFVPFIHQYVQWSPNTITLFFMWDVIRHYRINCFSGFSGPSIFLVLISWMLTHCTFFQCFQYLHHCTCLVNRWHVLTVELSFRPQFLPQTEHCLHTKITQMYKGIHVNCLIFVQFKPKSEYADTV